ncbi:MAG: Rv3235 family protein [Streptosporangiaceae bacterium]
MPAPGPEADDDADASTRQAGDKGDGSASGRARDTSSPARRQPGDADGGPRSGRAGRTPDGDGDRWPSQFAQVLAETLAGSRPASQITPWTTERARAHIRRLGPLLAAGQRPRVRRVLTSRPVEDVVEVAVVVGFGPRTRALAARLERADPQPATPGRPARQARWLCTDVESA